MSTRLRGTVGVGSVVLAIASAIVFVARDGQPDPPVLEPFANLKQLIEAPPGPATYADELRGFAVTYPAGWQVAPENQTPRLCCCPYEILTVATFGGHPGGLCAQYPSSAVDELSPTDALISIQERRIDAESPLSSFEPRPDHFGPRDGYADDSPECRERPQSFYHRFISFHDAGRGFYAYVAIGSNASRARRTEVWRILDNLVIEPGVESVPLP